jgi:hypothetical protein
MAHVEDPAHWATLYKLIAFNRDHMTGISLPSPELFLGVVGGGIVGGGGVDMRKQSMDATSYLS